MQYFGGKQRIAKQLISFLNENANGYFSFMEPFVGGCNIIPYINVSNKTACDKNEYIIETYNAIKNDWIPPQFVTEDEYLHIKNNKDENKKLTGFVGIGCSYSGKWFGGYARNKTGRNYCLNAYNSIMKIKDKIDDIEFLSADYKKLQPDNALIYCDPPYEKTTKYSCTGNFDTIEFWETMRKWSIDNRVFISEYNAPEDFICVWSKETKLDIRSKNGVRENRIEKLFSHKSQINNLLKV